jgi:hypothetical protein
VNSSTFNITNLSRDHYAESYARNINGSLKNKAPAQNSELFFEMKVIQSLNISLDRRFNYDVGKFIVALLVEDSTAKKIL